MVVDKISIFNLLLVPGKLLTAITHMHIFNYPQALNTQRPVHTFTHTQSIDFKQETGYKSKERRRYTAPHETKGDGCNLQRLTIK